jgi:hypothetical protein
VSENILEGQVVGEQSARKSKEGKLGIEFCLQDKRGNAKDCVLWTHVCRQDPNGLLPGREYILRGFKGSGGTFVVKSYTRKGDEEEPTHRSVREQILMDYCSMRGDAELPSWFYTEKGNEIYRKCLKELSGYMVAQGYVKAITSNGLEWVQEKWCVKHGEDWYERIHFCYKALGDERVIHEFKRFEKKYGSSVKTIDVKAYNEKFIPWLIQQAQESFE